MDAGESESSQPKAVFNSKFDKTRYEREGGQKKYNTHPFVRVAYSTEEQEAEGTLI